MRAAEHLLCLSPPRDLVLKLRGSLAQRLIGSKQFLLNRPDADQCTTNKPHWHQAQDNKVKGG
jgi:hypothetical protein